MQGPLQQTKGLRHLSTNVPLISSLTVYSLDIYFAKSNYNLSQCSHARMIAHCKTIHTKHVKCISKYVFLSHDCSPDSDSKDLKPLTGQFALMNNIFSKIHMLCKSVYSRDDRRIHQFNRITETNYTGKKDLSFPQRPISGAGIPTREIILFVQRIVVVCKPDKFPVTTWALNEHEQTCLPKRWTTNIDTLPRTANTVNSRSTQTQAKFCLKSKDKTDNF